MARRRRSLLGRRPDGGDDPSEEPADAPSLEDAPGVSAAPVVPDVPGTTVDPAVPAEADRGADPERSAFEASFGASERRKGMPRTVEAKASRREAAQVR